MNTKSAADLYQKASIENAPPLQVVRMLYQGLLRFLTQAEKTADNPAKYDENLRRADAILSELRRSLDHEVAPEFAETLDSLYVFCEAQLAQAMIDKDPSLIENARGVLSRLLEGWSHVSLNNVAGPGAGECESTPNSNS